MASLGCAQLKVYNGELLERMQELLSHDLCITINSDDPSYFGGYVGEYFVNLLLSLHCPLTCHL